MVKVPKVKNALFGLPLDIGTKIIGLIHIVFYTTCFIIVLVKERTPDDFTHHHDNSTNATTNSSSSVHLNETTAINETEYDSLEEEIIHKSFIELSASYFNDFALLVQMTFAAFLLLGVYKKNLDYMLSWVLLQVANMVFSLFFVVVYFIAVFRVYAPHYTQYLICEEITVTLVVGYCVIVVNSYTDELMKSNTDREEQMSPIVINSPDSPTINHRVRR